jgi:methyl-accepting chemotaxis protein
MVPFGLGSRFFQFATVFRSPPIVAYTAPPIPDPALRRGRSFSAFLSSGVVGELLNAAITSHARWKGQLTEAIDRGQLPDPISVRADDRCDLGKWIHGAGTAYQTEVEYQNLKLLHAQFHETAASVVEIIINDNKANAKVELESGTLAEASMKVINAISNVQKLVGEWKPSK